VINKILKYAGIAIACLTIVALSSALLYRKYLQHEVSQARAISSPDGIDSLQAVHIGGIDQWIEVRGQNVNNPILLFIHGGPGVAFIAMGSSFQDSWEKYFTVVEWDQRGAGKTYESNDKELQRRTLTLAQMEQDTLEVANYLRTRFKREKIFVVGHSWGSMLGLWLAHEHPEMIYAFVGTGQAVSMQQNEEAGYRIVLEAARRRNNEQAIKELEGVAPYPPAVPDMNKTTMVRNWESALLGPPASQTSFTNVKRILRTVISAPEYSIADDIGFVRGSTFSLQVMMPQMMAFDLTKLGRDFREPLFFFEGRMDPYCPGSVIADYIQTIDAPDKEIVWFENSSHFPFYEERQKFTDELIQRVLPLAALSSRRRLLPHAIAGRNRC
jgi:pimeloyl-ACP methyl ester carboxylesterase